MRNQNAVGWGGSWISEKSVVKENDAHQQNAGRQGLGLSFHEPEAWVIGQRDWRL